jgi:hypothetical protein
MRVCRKPRAMTSPRTHHDAVANRERLAAHDDEVARERGDRALSGASHGRTSAVLHRPAEGPSHRQTSVVSHRHAAGSSHRRASVAWHRPTVVARDLRPGVGYLATRSSRHAGKHSDGCGRPLDARVGRAPADARSLNLADPLSRLLLSPLTLLGMPRIASLPPPHATARPRHSGEAATAGRETPGRPAVRRERSAPISGSALRTDMCQARTDKRYSSGTDPRKSPRTNKRQKPCTDTRQSSCTDTR